MGCNRTEDLDTFVEDQEILQGMEMDEQHLLKKKGEYQTRTGNEVLSQQEICIEIPLENDAVQFIQQHKTVLHEIIKSKFDCIATVCKNENLPSIPATTYASDEDLSPVEITSLPAGVRYMKTLSGGFRIFVCLDDLTKHKVDAVVNTANEYLKHDQGLARALARTAGREFEVESNNIVQVRGAVPVGSAVVTGAGCLPFKKVIHAVGPIWGKHPSSKSDRLLMSAIRNSLVLANELQMTSIAIPAVSSGDGFPLQRCAELIVNAIKTFHGTWQLTDPLKEIHLVNFCKPTAEAIQNACKNLLGDTEQKHLLNVDFTPNRIRDIFEFEKLHFEIKRENIENQNTDVIVNTISRDLNLNLYRVSKAIAEKAGPDLQKELYRITKTELISFGEVLKTPGFQLSCDYVYHAVYSPNESQKVLKKIICKCLELVKEDNIRSIAFPITTDAKLSKKVAKLLIEEIINFVEFNENTRLATVYFVLHPAETEIYEWFKATLLPIEVGTELLKQFAQSAARPHTRRPSPEGGGTGPDSLDNPPSGAEEPRFSPVDLLGPSSMDDSADFEEPASPNVVGSTQQAFLHELFILKQIPQQKEKLITITDSTCLKREREQGTELLIKLCGKDYPFLERAQFWINNTILLPQEHLIIENKNISYFTTAEHEVLAAHREMKQISMEETVNIMGTFIELSGPHFEMLDVALHIEHLLCELQEEMARVIECELLQSLVQWVYTKEEQINEYVAPDNFILEKAFLDKKVFVSIDMNDTKQTIYLQRLIALTNQRDEFKIERVVQGKEDYLKSLPTNWGPIHSSVFWKIPMDMTRLEFQKLINDFTDAGLTIVKIEKIQNPVLWTCHLRHKEMNETMIKDESQIAILYYRVPDYFCNFVCRIGFQEMYSQEHEQEYGDGMYFRSEVKQLMNRINNVGEIIHIFEAEVFIGNCNKECSSNIFLQDDGCDCYEYIDNTVANAHPSKTYVIFNSAQAYPKYLIACRRVIYM
uniref:protein mono-ADP-ribosyltransferase PARP9 n=1 Tax=Pristiophorus japonicus TaxID=55135 RepID=UPI00398EA252